MQFIVAYLATGAAFLALDMVWLGFIATGFYRDEMGPLLADPINVPAALAFYLLYVFGLVVFAVLPGVSEHSVLRAAGLGALLGLIAYGTYDLTGLAVIRGFSSKLALVDMAWGLTASALAASAGAFAASRF